MRLDDVVPFGALVAFDGEVGSQFHLLELLGVHRAVVADVAGYLVILNCSLWVAVLLIELLDILVVATDLCF